MTLGRVRMHGLLIVTIVALTPSCAGGTGARSPLASAVDCRFHEIERRSLTLQDGSLVYVEADVFVSDGAGMLLAGVPNIITTMDGDMATGLLDDTILGVILGDDDSVTAIDMPEGVHNVTTVRGASSSTGGWYLLFTDSVDGGPHTRVWFGEHDGRGWVHVDTLTGMPGSDLAPEFASKLHVLGDTISWAVTGGQRTWLAHRHDGTWHVDTIPTFAVAARLGSSGHSQRLLLVQSDRSLRTDGNSLFMWAREPDWTPLRRLVYGDGDGQVFGPEITAIGDSAVVTWFTPMQTERRTEVRAMWLTESGDIARTVVVDSAVRAFGTRYVPLEMTRGRLVWALDPSAQSAPGILRVVVMEDGVLRGRRDLPDPYLGFAAATVVNDGTIVVTGLHNPEGRHVVSLLVSLRLECSDK